MLSLLHLITWMLTGIPAANAEPTGASTAAKVNYNLFNPTPVDQLREMSTDRPDTTESPYTVDAGHMQFEWSYFDWTTIDSHRDAFAIMSTNIKVGLTNSLDAQFIIDPYVKERNSETTLEGISDLTLRLKFNVWGNDSEDTALAFMPFLTFPIGSDEVSSNDYEGGVIVPFAFGLPGDFDVGLMVEADVIRNSDDTDYAVDLVHTAALGHGVVGDLAAFLEYAGSESSESDIRYRSSINHGYTYALSENFILDAGIRIGLNDATDDLGFFLGSSFRR